MATARYALRFETADGTIEAAYHHMSRKADAIAAARLMIFVDYANPAEREFPESPRYLLRAMGDDISDDKDIAASDDWSVILAAIDAHMIFAPIEATRAAAETWLAALAASEFNYHLDDSPETIINGRTGAALFTADQCKAIRANIETVSSVMDWNSVWEFYYAESQKRDDF